IDENGNEVWPIVHLDVVWSENPCTTLTYVWDQRDQNGFQVPPGVYRVVLTHCELLTGGDVFGLPFICFRIGFRPTGDLNGDGTADSVDLGAVRNALGSQNLLCDLNGDGRVNYEDFGLEYGFYLGWQIRNYTYAPPIEGTATVFGLVILEIAIDNP
ncbi:MAG: dockerin type I repeat-containing protein, partial [Candidatus Bathyarchaeia archaeon]